MRHTAYVGLFLLILVVTGCTKPTGSEAGYRLGGREPRVVGFDKPIGLGICQVRFKAASDYASFSDGKRRLSVTANLANVSKDRKQLHMRELDAYAVDDAGNSLIRCKGPSEYDGILIDPGQVIEREFIFFAPPAGYSHVDLVIDHSEFGIQAIRIPASSIKNGKDG